jgi:retron-type reverse transcriptase
MRPLAMLDRAIAGAFLAGEPTVARVIERITQMLGRPWRWIPRVARRFVQAFPHGGVRPRQKDVVRLLRRDPGFRRALPKMSVEYWLLDAQRMQPVTASEGWPVPRIETAGALADWLQLDLGDLEWFADLHGLNRKGRTQLRHYHYRVLTKQSGTMRLIEAPKPRLKELQRKILAGILEKIPPHPAVHGFLKGHSIKTFAAPHVGQRVVLKMDLEDFFPSISGARVQALFRTIGYPEAVADLLGGICTTVAPYDIWKPRDLYTQPHLPQGAPTSPALGNLCAYRVDCRLSGLAKSVGAVYTRYADDLAFSGGEPFERSVDRFATHVAAILYEHGFSVHHRKTRIMRQGVRQNLAGLVANQRLNIRRSDFDRLKATLTNCLRLGPESQNRESHPHYRLHLEGKVAFVASINAARGKRLGALFDRIQWN